MIETSAPFSFKVVASCQTLRSKGTGKFQQLSKHVTVQLIPFKVDGSINFFICRMLHIYVAMQKN